MEITKLYLPVKTKRRPGTKNGGIKFIVVHDTGNPGSEKWGPATAKANVQYYIATANDEEASAHYFVDDREIIECIPPDEVAYHVIYDKPTDNFIYGDDANSCAIGVEICYGLGIDMERCYWNAVWLINHLLNQYGLTPLHVTAHTILDPTRKTDPAAALKQAGRSWMKLIEDVAMFNQH